MNIFDKLFHRTPKEQEDSTMKYLIACLGNIGAEYVNTRHNAGFAVGDHLAKEFETTFTTDRLAQTATAKYKGRTLLIIKPTTYMNLSGKAVQYWLRQEKIPIENLLVVVDDIALPLATLRLKPKGSDGGHNGLANIIEALGTNVFARLRFGLGDDYPKGRQIDFVLGQWKASEQPVVDQKLDTAVEIIKSFVTQGLEPTMNQFNNK